MLAYLFWHRPPDGADPVAYEDALLGFHAALAAAPAPGFVRSYSYARHDNPWFDGYEDWYLVGDWTALGALNAAAVDRAHKTPHDAVAVRSQTGAGAVYALVRGDTEPGAAAVWSDAPSAEGTLWQRQMVLGPAPEFCALHDAAAAPGVLPRTVLTASR